MFTANEDVGAGQANGSRVNLVKINVKPGEQCMPVKLACGTTVRAYKANQIKSLLVRHEVEDMCPREFTVEPKKYTFKAEFETHVGTNLASMTATQFPLISNSCTTGHKLQGYTAVSLLVNNWEYTQNWAYVVLSRVKTMAGLYLRQPLTENLKKPRSTISVRMLDDDDYQQLLDNEKSLFD